MHLERVRWVHMTRASVALRNIAGAATTAANSTHTDTGQAADSGSMKGLVGSQHGSHRGAVGRNTAAVHAPLTNADHDRRKAKASDCRGASVAKLFNVGWNCTGRRGCYPWLHCRVRRAATAAVLVLKVLCTQPCLAA